MALILQGQREDIDAILPRKQQRNGNPESEAFWARCGILVPIFRHNAKADQLTSGLKDFGQKHGTDAGVLIVFMVGGMLELHTERPAALEHPGENGLKAVLPRFFS